MILKEDNKININKVFFGIYYNEPNKITEIMPRYEFGIFYKNESQEYIDIISSIKFSVKNRKPHSLNDEMLFIDDNTLIINETENARLVYIAPLIKYIPNEEATIEEIISTIKQMFQQNRNHVENLIVQFNPVGKKMTCSKMHL